MKTQINKLINGSAHVYRNMEDEKYANAEKGTSTYFAGTSLSERLAVAEAVIAENDTHLRILLKGKEFNLTCNRSGKGNILDYSCEITKEDYLRIFGMESNIKTFEVCYVLSVYRDMTVWIDTYARRNRRCKWEWRGYGLWLGEVPPCTNV